MTGGGTLAPRTECPVPVSASAVTHVLELSQQWFGARLTERIVGGFSIPRVKLVLAVNKGGVDPPFSEIRIAGMPQCLFCLREGEGDAVHFTDEHVFPAALGGNLVVKDGTCDKCSHGNSKFEQALAIELTPIRMLLQVPDRYGKVPHTAATLVTPEKTYDGRVKGDGSVVVKPVITQEKNEKGDPEFVHRFLTDVQKEKLREQARKKGQQLIETGPGDPVTAEVHIGGDLMVIGSPEGLRTVAKIAYVGLAHLVGVKVPSACLQRSTAIDP